MVGRTGHIVQEFYVPIAAGYHYHMIIRHYVVRHGIGPDHWVLPHYPSREVRPYDVNRGGHALGRLVVYGPHVLDWFAVLPLVELLESIALPVIEIGFVVAIAVGAAELQELL